MEEKIIVNGREYTVWITENEQLAREICAQTFNGYSLKHATNAYMTKFYKVFGATHVDIFDENGNPTKITKWANKKEIGQLYYDPDAHKYHLFKYLDPKIHVMKKTGEVGVNGAIYAKLRVGDYIHFTIGKKKYKIRVEKAAKVGNYKNFGATAYNSELQFFIPMSELTEIESKKKTTRTAKRKRA